MDRRRFLIGSVGVGGALVLGACARTEDESPTGTTATTPDSGTEGALPRPTLSLAGNDIGLPSPFTYMRGPGLVHATLVYDTLVWKDSSGEILPWLAEEFEASDDGRTHTFQLREGITWHDGQPLTAEDVAFTFEYFNAQTLSPQVIAQPFPQIEEVRATDDRTVEFQLASPLADFYGFGGVGSILIVPQHIWSDVADATTASDPALLVGSGPFKLESYTQGEGAYLYTANDDYFLGTPFVERLEYRPVGEALPAVVAGDLDAASAPGLRPEVLAPFRDNPSLEILEAPPGNFGSALYWNLAKGGALADVNFRHACARAIDREDMVERLHGGNAQRGNPGWVPEGNPAHVDVEQYEFDRAQAESLLDEAGYTLGDGGVRQGPDGPLRFSLLTTNPPPPTADLVKTALGEVGIELTVESLDTPAFNKRVIAGDTEMSIIGFGGMNTDYGEGGYLRQVYSSKTKITQHAQGYENPEVDRLLEEQQVTLDEEERRKLVGQVQELIAEDLPLLPLVYPTGFTIFNPDSFAEWYYTEGGVASTVPTIENKHVFITGRDTGLEIRPFEEGG
ncbi:MAG TPA: ABC transporter substrate-binding protein [Acidimicrobiales bacterium]|nr:ABC transporter substrate-binding protein [Acidimicrobiales bacterium]